MKELKVIFSKKWNFLKKMNFRKKIFKKVNMWPSKIEISFWIFVFERNTFKSIGKTTNKTCIHNWLVGEWQKWSKETMNGNEFNTHEIEKKNTNTPKLMVFLLVWYLWIRKMCDVRFEMSWTISIFYAIEVERNSNYYLSWVSFQTIEIQL